MVPMHKCPVYYNLMIPDDLKSNPHAILTSHGVHNHPAPSPHRQPRFILSELTDVIANMDVATLTRSTFSDQLENVLQPIQERLLIRMQTNFSSVHNFDSSYRSTQRLLSFNYISALITIIR